MSVLLLLLLLRPRRFDGVVDLQRAATSVWTIVLDVVIMCRSPWTLSLANAILGMFVRGRLYATRLKLNDNASISDEALGQQSLHLQYILVCESGNLRSYQGG